MARTVSTGWRKVTPGACAECGSDMDYGVDGRGTVLCSCSPDFDESFDTTEAGKPQSHWSYGSGMSGCLYDHGPCFAETLEGAIDGALFVFDDLPESELALARKALAFEGIWYFDCPEAAGAQYVEVSEQPGPMPEEDQ